jgi:hypothetical protein
MTDKYVYVDNIINNFFSKQKTKTSHETLANYQEDLIPGGENGFFYTHINFHTIHNSLLWLLKKKESNFIFVETGCSAHGTKSTILWDKFVNTFGGAVFSVDLSKESVVEARRHVSDKTTITHSDSLLYLPKLEAKIDFLYLDSYDVDFLSPKPSAEHHLKEFNCVKHLLEKGSVVLIDDTPISPEWLDDGKKNPIYERLKNQFDPNMCGKGSLVNQELEKMGATKVMHQYQSLWIV